MNVALVLGAVVSGPMRVVRARQPHFGGVRRIAGVALTGFEGDR